MSSLIQSKGILSDRRIRRLCIKPTHNVYINAVGGLIHQDYNISAPFTAEEESLIDQRRFGGRSSLQEYVSITELSEDSHVLKTWEPMISPYEPKQVRHVGSQRDSDSIDDILKTLRIGAHTQRDIMEAELTMEKLKHTAIRKVISFGQSSYGYDLRVGRQFKIFTNVNNTIIDPKHLDPSAFVDFEGDVCIIPPNSFALAASMEYLIMPKNVTGIVLAKSTYARTGQGCLATPLEAGWRGQVTLEYANNTPLPMKLYAGEGAAQVLFFEGDDCDTPYDDTRKYQGQTGITLPRL